MLFWLISLNPVLGSLGSGAELHAVDQVLICQWILSLEYLIKKEWVCHGVLSYKWDVRSSTRKVVSASYACGNLEC